MKKKLLNINIFLYFALILSSFFINFYYANIGVFPIDTFAFFDTAYNILLDRHPFKDIWVTTGPVVDYFQAFFFRLLGANWKSYVIHSSVLNCITAVFFYYTLLKLNFNKYLGFFYVIFFSFLAYPVSGTPFAYLHSYSLSLLSFLVFVHCIKFRSNFSFFILPVIIFFAFFSMQNPSTFIGLIIFFSLLVYFFYYFEIKIFVCLCAGSFFTLIIFLTYLNLTGVLILDIWHQYFSFPLAMGEYRFSGNELAHISLEGRSTIRNIFGHFKFIDFYILLFLGVTIFEIYKKKISKTDLILNFSLIFLGISLIFNQLLTSNQTYIFSIIPFLASFFHLIVNKNYLAKNSKIHIFLFSLIIFCTIKYHLEYNEKRKFMDLQNTDLTKTINARIFDKKLEGLKWITPIYKDNPQEELMLLTQAKNLIADEKKNKMVLTEYQFFSLILEENLHILNRWYTHDNISYPLSNHKNFLTYKNHINKIFNKEKIEVIFTIGNIQFENFKIYFDNICFDKLKINSITYSYNILKCD